MFSTFEKIKELSQKRGISLQNIAEDLGFSVNYLYTLKEKTPKSDRLQEIADYFHVSTDYLLGRTDVPAVNTKESFTFEGQEVDVEQLASTAMRFNGKPLTDKDKKAIQNFENPSTTLFTRRPPPKITAFWTRSFFIIKK